MSLARRIRDPVNWIGMTSVVLLGVLSVLNLRRADYYTNQNFAQSQIVWFVVSLIAAGVVAGLNIQWFRRFASWGYVVLVVLLVAVLVAGREVNMSKRWLEWSGMSLQPSEFMKLAIVLMLADWFDRARGQEPWGIRGLAQPIVATLIPVGLILLQPDLGTAIVVAATGMSIMFYDGIRRSTVAALVAVMLVAVPIGWEYGLIREYQKGRVEAWLELDDTRERSPGEAAHRPSQAEQALWAVGSGQLAGRPAEDAKRSTLGHLPYLNTDFILAAWAEEHGFVGCVALFALFLLIVWWGLRLAREAKDRFDALVAVGVSGIIFWQFFINVGMVIGLLPVVGITLPMMSYGGSSLMTVMLGVGFLLNVAFRGS